MVRRLIGLLLLGACATPLPPGTVAVVEADAPASPDLKMQGQDFAPTALNAPRVKKLDIGNPSTAKAMSTAEGGGVDELTVIGHSLSGYWLVTGPKRVQVETSLFNGVHIRYSPEADDRNICLIHDRQTSLDATCVMGSLQSASGSREGTRLSLHWWRGPLNLIFDGTLQDANTIEGKFSGGMLGISVTGGIPTLLTRLEAEPSEARASAMLLRAVFDDVAKDHQTEGRYEGKAITQLQPRWSDLRQAGALNGVTYLGTIRNRWQPKQRETVQDIYRVELVGGVELCRIALSETGTVAEFDCRAVAL